MRSVGAVIRGGAGLRTGAELCRLNRGYLREIPRYILIYPGKSGHNKRLKIMTENPLLDHDRDYLRIITPLIRNVISSEDLDQAPGHRHVSSV